jgi:hypothetical protein
MVRCPASGGRGDYATVDFTDTLDQADAGRDQLIARRGHI